MRRRTHLQSIFSQTLDRAVFATYFLGAVVPLIALAVVIHRYALPTLDRGADRYAMFGMVAMILAVGLLSLAAFFALRRLTLHALWRMKADNRRLSTILLASRDLSGAIHTHAVADTAATCARALTDVEATIVLLQPDADKPPTICEASGEEAQRLYQRFEQPLRELIDAALETRSPVLLENRGDRSDGAAAEAPVCAAAVPFRVAKDAWGAFLLIDTAPKSELSSEQLDAVSTLASLTSVAFQNAELQDSQRNFFSHVTEILVAALDAQLDRGDPRAGHPDRIAAVANSLGRELGVAADDLQRLHFGALLHDIGYLKLDRALHYDAAECKNHPVLGHRMLSRIRLWEEVAPIVLYHHEWFDGSGYPEQRAGSDIPLEARIVAVADAFDKLTHEDFEGPVLGVPEAFAKIRERRGQQFDPSVVDALGAIIERGELVA
jgi:putative nucleotidyltransferase with HDIG domain